jgi:two-component sensor histidine kinase
LVDLRYRINALGLVHQQMMVSEDLSTFDVRPFLDELRQNLAASAGLDRRGIALSLHSDALTVDLDFAIPLGLLVTELTTNAVKHAFAGGTAGTMEIALRRCPNDTVLLTVCDNGRGGRDGGGTPGSNGRLGSRIMEALVEQLDGEMAVPKVEDAAGGTPNGTRVEIRMPLPESAKGSART